MKELLAIALAAIILFLCSEGLNLTVAPGDLMTLLSQWFGAAAFVTLMPALAVWCLSGKR